MMFGERICFSPAPFNFLSQLHLLFTESLGPIRTFLTRTRDCRKDERTVVSLTKKDAVPSALSTCNVSCTLMCKLVGFVDKKLKIPILFTDITSCPTHQDPDCIVAVLSVLLFLYQKHE
jgi:hypothetical protein